MATGRVDGFLRKTFASTRGGLLYCVVVVALIWAAYYPSLGHMPRADQWAFLLDTIDRHDFGELLAHTYSYNRTRQVGPGDTDLFRPVLFALLCAEKALFGTNFAAVQAVGIGLHCLVVLLLFRLLRRIAGGRPSTADPGGVNYLDALAYALPVFFALNFSIQELVVWSHLHGYLLFLVLVLGSMLLLLRYVQEPEAPRVRRRLAILGAWALALLAAFTYELGQLYAAAAGLFLAAASPQRGWRPRALALAVAFAAIFVAYQTVDRLDRARHRGRYPEENVRAQIVRRAASADTLRHTGRFLIYTTFQPFFPSAMRWWPQGGRINVQEATHAWGKYLEPSVRLVASYVVFGTFLLLSLSGLQGVLGKDGRALRPVVALLAGLFGLYAAMTVLGRMNVRAWPDVLEINSYYPYLALAFFLPAAFAAWQGLPRTGGASRSVNAAAACLGVGLIYLGLAGGMRVQHVAARLAELDRQRRDMASGVAELVREHGHEPDFSLAFDFAHSDPLDGPHGVPFPLVLFKRYVDNHQPKHVVTFRDGKALVTSGTEYARRDGAADQLFPDLVRVGTHYNVYRFRGWYYGTLAWDGYFRPDCEDHAYLLKGGTLQEIGRQEVARLAELHADRLAGRFVQPGTEVRAAGTYRNFNLYQADRFCYGFPAEAGTFDVRRFNAGGYSGHVVAESVAALRRAIDALGGGEVSEPARLDQRRATP